MLKDYSDIPRGGYIPDEVPRVIFAEERFAKRAQEFRAHSPEPGLQVSPASFQSNVRRERQAPSLLEEYGRRREVRTELEDTSFLWREFHQAALGNSVDHIVVEPGELFDELHEGSLTLDGRMAGQIVLRVLVPDRRRRWKFEVHELSISELSTFLLGKPYALDDRMPKPDDWSENAETLYLYIGALHDALKERTEERAPALERFLASTVENPKILRYSYIRLSSIQ